MAGWERRPSSGSCAIDHAALDLAFVKVGGLRKEKGSMEKKVSAEKAVREIRRKTRRRFSSHGQFDVFCLGVSASG